MMKDMSKVEEAEQPKKTPKPLDAFIQMKKDNRWKVFGQSAFITLSSIAIFGGVGWAIDTWIRGEGHAFFISLLIMSYPVTQIALYKRMKFFNSLKK